MVKSMLFISAVVFFGMLIWIAQRFSLKAGHFIKETALKIFCNRRRKIN